jgi:hypothetical protein
MTSYRVWVPSKQKYVRIYELNCEQFRNILKVIDEEQELDFILTDILEKNICDSSYKIEDFTVIDKFIIYLQLRIRSCGPNLNLVRICDKCDEKTKLNINLNNIIDKLAPVVDCSFQKTFTFLNSEIECDLSYISRNDNLEYDRSDYNKRLDKYLFSFIKTMKFLNSDIKIDLRNIDEISKNQICEAIPFEIINTIKNEYIDKINETLYNTLFIDSVCKNENCKSVFSVNLDINNINDIIRILFSDSSALNILIKYINLSSTSHFDFSFYKNISPLELNILVKMIEDSQKEEPSSNKEMNLFEEYRSQTDGMQQTPSEFK